MPPPPGPSDPRTEASRPGNGVSRRGFIQTLGLSSAAAAIGDRVDAAQSAAAEGGPVVLGPGPVPIVLTVNGARTTLTAEPSTTLLEALRLNLGLTGSKEVCDRGACGACSVLLDGALVASCMMLAIDAAGRSITTIEGIARGDALDPVQHAFVKHDALQCGFCTPGLVVACKALLAHTPKPTLDEIKRGLSGNICRCGAYTNIFNAVLEASGQPVPVDPAPIAVAPQPATKGGE